MDRSPTPIRVTQIGDTVILATDNLKAKLGACKHNGLYQEQHVTCLCALNHRCFATEVGYSGAP
jgi:hypothetical protein